MDQGCGGFCCGEVKQIGRDGIAAGEGAGAAGDGIVATREGIGAGNGAGAAAGAGCDGAVGPGLEEREVDGRDDEPVLRGVGVPALEESLVGERRRRREPDVELHHQGPRGGEHH